MKISRLVLGTGNKAKLAEWQKFLSPYFEIIPLTAFPSVPEVVESGNSFTENAVIKAQTYAKAFHEYVFSEDGGYEIDALDGKPGVKSRRILPGDQDGTDDQLIDYVIEVLKGVPDEKRGVKLTSSTAISDPEGHILFTDISSSIGLVTRARGPVLIPGYPYRTLHFLREVGKTYAELTPEEHDRLSHKKPIAEKIIAQFSK